MCRGYQPNKREILSVKEFYLRLSSFSIGRKKALLPDSLTLHLLPRINGSFLEIDGSSIPPNTHGFITMHRIVSPAENNKLMMINRHGAVYGCREILKASEGSRFEIFMADAKLLKGFIIKDESEKWELECKCSLEGDELLDFVKEIDICVAVEEQSGPIYKKVEMKSRRRRKFRCFEDIPEEKENESEEGEEKETLCWCDECCGGGGGGDGKGNDNDNDNDNGNGNGNGDVDVESTEGVTWAVDVGIWVMCLGFGYFVSTATYRRLRHTRLF